MVKTPQTVDDWLPCLTLPEYVSMTPSGHIAPIVGPEIWIDGRGFHYTKQSYIEKYGIDPEIAWKAVKEYRKRAGKEDKTVML